MKTRMGFVSNSSSSSFIIALDEGTEPTVENIHRAIWDTDESIYFEPEYDNDPGVDSKDVAEAIVQQISSADPDGWQIRGKLDDDTLAKVVNVPYSQSPSLRDYRINSANASDYSNAYDHAAYQKAYDALHAKEAATLKSRFPGKDLYAVEFGDENSDWESEVEHGPALDRNTVVRYSKH